MLFEKYKKLPIVMFILLPSCSVEPAATKNPSQTQLGQKEQFSTPMRPYNFPQERNWCWLVATLQCIYRLDPVRSTLSKVAPSDVIPPIREMVTKAKEIISSMNKQNIREKTLDFVNFITSKNYLNGLSELPSVKELHAQHALFWQSYPDEDKRVRAKPEIYTGQVYELSKRSAFKYQFLEDTLADDMSGSSDPWNAVNLMLIPLENIANIKNSVDFFPVSQVGDSAKNIFIASFDAEAKPTIKDVPEEIKSSHQTFELIAMVMQKHNSHAVALVKYDHAWILYDSLESAQPMGRTLGESFASVLALQAGIGYFPYIVFYQRK